ncbi:MAG: hypothetical protein K0B10_04395 [Vicingaceae bacterium]|nr:hypothetical protein [Vicingaceae bacterium]
MSSKKQIDFLNNQNLLVLMYKWRKPLIIVSIIAFIVSVVTSFLIKETYQSTVTLFPSTINSVSKALISRDPIKEDLLKFGEKEEAEQMFQILLSDKIRNQTIRNLNLIEYYGIDTTQSKWKTDLKETFQGNVTFNITKFAAIEINVLDYSPAMAAKIANEIANLLDTVTKEIKNQIALNAVHTIETEYSQKAELVKALQDSLTLLRILGINEFDSQVERYTEQLSIAILENKTNAIKELEKRLAVFSTHGDKFIYFRDKLFTEQKQLYSLALKLDEIKLDISTNVSSKFVIDYATPADKKHAPKRMLIVLISTMSAFLLAFVFLLLRDSISKLKLSEQA